MFTKMILETKKISKLNQLIVLCSISLYFSACASNDSRVKELESTISLLESRLAEYQDQSFQKTNQADIAATQALRSQEGLQTLLQQIANRLAALERQSNTMQLQVNRLEEYSSETATLSQRVQEQVIATSNRVDLFQNNLVQFNKDLEDIRTLLEASNQKNRSELEAISSHLNSKINNLEKNMNQTMAQLSRQQRAQIVQPPEQNNQTQRQPVRQPVQQPERQTEPRPPQTEQRQPVANQPVNNQADIEPQIVSPQQPAPQSNQQTTAGPVESGTGKIVHEVVVGDKLSELALRYNTTMEAIMELNNIKDPNHIMLGQKLQIP